MHLTRFIGLSLLAGALAWGVCCTHAVEVTYSPGVTEPPVHTCPVSLSLCREFCEFQHTTPAVFLVHDSFTAEFGPHLRAYAIHVAKSYFGDVEVLDGGSARTGSKLLLEPKVLSSDLYPATDVLSRATGSLSVQWAFRDPKTGQILLRIPVYCEYTHPPKLRQKLPNVTAGLMTKLTDTTLDRFRESEDLQQLMSPSK